MSDLWPKIRFSSLKISDPAPQGKDVAVRILLCNGGAWGAGRGAQQLKVHEPHFDGRQLLSDVDIIRLIISVGILLFVHKVEHQKTQHFWHR